MFKEREDTKITQVIEGEQIYFEFIEDMETVGRTQIALCKNGEKEYGIKPKTAALGDIHINESCRNKGYGSKLLKEAEDSAKSNGMKHMEIRNVVNPDFFTKFGYVYKGYGRTFIKSFDKNPTNKQISDTNKYLKEYGLKTLDKILATIKRLKEFGKD